jgi:hypothetical protein
LQRSARAGTAPRICLAAAAQQRRGGATNALSRENELLPAQLERARLQVERAEKKAEVGHGK